MLADICNIYHLCYSKETKTVKIMQSNNRYIGMYAKLNDSVFLVQFSKVLRKRR